MRTLRYVVADVFTDTPLTGNQLAVFTDARGLDDATMQALALEVGFSETVFVLPPESGGNVRIRIFTPHFELPFAGHPTLGTAFVLGAPLQLGVITLETGRGNVPVTLERDESGRIVFGRMEQPVPTVDPFPAGAALCEALGVAGSELPIELYDNGATHLLVALGSEEEVAALRPNVAAVVDVRGDRRQLLRGVGRPLEDPDVLGRRRGCSDRLGCRAARLPPGTARPNRLGPRDRHLPGCRDRPSLDPLRAGRGRRRADRPRRGRRAGCHGRPRRVPARRSTLASRPKPEAASSASCVLVTGFSRSPGLSPRAARAPRTPSRARCRTPGARRERPCRRPSAAPARPRPPPRPPRRRAATRSSRAPRRRRPCGRPHR